MRNLQIILKYRVAGIWLLHRKRDKRAATLQQTGAPMTILRFYSFDPDGHIRRPAEEVECENDGDARVKVAAMLIDVPAGWKVEVWDGARLIAKGMSIGDSGDTLAVKSLHASNEPAMWPTLRGLRAVKANALAQT